MTIYPSSQVGRTIIAGGREYTHNHYHMVEAAVAASGFSITSVLSGCAKGIDTVAIDWAYAHGIPVVRFHARWDELGKKAGVVRNEEMACNADALIAIPGNGRGTRDMIQRAHKHGLRVYVYELSAFFASFQMG